MAAIVVSSITLLLYPLRELDPGVSSGVLYVLGVLLVALGWGLWLGALTAVASASGLAYFHTGAVGDFPRGDFRSDTVAIGVMLVTALVASLERVVALGADP